MARTVITYYYLMEMAIMIVMKTIAIVIAVALSGVVDSRMKMILLFVG